MSELEKIKQKLAIHEKRISELEKLFKSKPVPTMSSEVVLDLINSSFFNNPKKYGEIIKELKIKAQFDKKHKYKEILEKFVREDKLERKIVDHQWMYAKK